MKHFVLESKLVSEDIKRIMEQCWQAGLPLEHVTPKGNGQYQFTFRDEAGDQTWQQVKGLADTYDPVAAAAAAEQARQEILNDISPLRNATTLLTEIENDETQVNNASLAEMRQLLRRSLIRERKLIRALTRLVIPKTPAEQ